jgi:ABC-2 type transport system permease protein
MRLWPVVRREYLERVRTKAFIIGTVLGPIFMAALTILPIVLTGRPGKPLRIAILDEAGALGPELERALVGEERNGQRRFIVEPADPGAVAERERALKDAVLAGRLDGFLRLPKDALERSAAEYYGKNVANVVDLGLLERTVEQILVRTRLSGAGVDPGRVAHLTRGVDLRKIRLSAAGEREDRGASFLLSFALVMMIYTTLAMWGQAVLTSVIEEKSNRVVEVIVSAIPPVRLLAGKLLGVGAVALTQSLVWVLSLALLSAVGASMAVASGMGGLPEIGLPILGGFIVCFLLGFLLYASMFAAVGSSVNTTQEAQSLVFPVFLPLIVCMMVFPMVLQSPDSTLSTVLSLVPFFTPILMFLRIAVLTPPWWQIGLAFLLTGLTIAGVLFVAGRIYRVGILMYGKRPTFPEIMRWVGRS